MSRIYVVKYADLDDSGVLQAFTSKEEAERYVTLLTLEKEDEDSEFLMFYTIEVGLYNTCEDIDG